jgi:hydroxymethylpyrimidine/phosphomethylpyrimidine kinase
MTAIALTIAGSDSGGGAGIQADLKTFSALGVYGASAVTAVTAQNTTGVRAVSHLPADMVTAQIDAVLEDMAVGAIKIGMAGNTETIVAIADVLRRHGRRAVVDPVMVATSGDRLLGAEAVDALVRHLLPLAIIATPNLPEAALLSGMPIARDEADMIRQGHAILNQGAAAVLVKGGHLGGPESVDILVAADGPPHRFVSARLPTRHDHGTGCTLSAAIAAELAKGVELCDAVATAKGYLTRALAAADGLNVGRGRGPVHHFHRWWGNSNR